MASVFEARRVGAAQTGTLDSTASDRLPASPSSSCPAGSSANPDSRAAAARDVACS
jgi:hypothetical protein